MEHSGCSIEDEDEKLPYGMVKSCLLVTEFLIRRCPRRSGRMVQGSPSGPGFFSPPPSAGPPPLDKEVIRRRWVPRKEIQVAPVAPSPCLPLTCLVGVRLLNPVESLRWETGFLLSYVTCRGARIMRVYHEKKSDLNWIGFGRFFWTQKAESHIMRT